jgi:hypothetical protein
MSLRSGVGAMGASSRIQGWVRASAAVRRREGSRSRSRRTRSIAAGDTADHAGPANVGAACWMAAMMPGLDPPPDGSKGWYPDRTMKEMTPSAQQSTGAPYPGVVGEYISGEPYAQVLGRRGRRGRRRRRTGGAGQGRAM